MIYLNVSKSFKSHSVESFRKTSAPSEQINECIFLLWHEKALLSFSKRGRGGLVEARLRTAYIRQQSYGPRPYERKHPLPCLTDVFPEVLILLPQSNQGCQRLVIIPLSLVRSFIVARLHPYEQVSLSVNYKRKNVGACICLSHSSGLPQPIAKEQTEKHPRWGI